MNSHRNFMFIFRINIEIEPYYCFFIEMSYSFSHEWKYKEYQKSNKICLICLGTSRSIMKLPEAPKSNSKMAEDFKNFENL